MLYHEVINNDPKFEWKVLIHGIAGSMRTWYKQLDDYSKEYNILLIDLPGHGESIDIDDVEKRNPHKINNEICKLMNKYNIEKAHFEAMSLGTIVLFLFILEYPKKVLSAVLAGAITELNSKLKIGLSAFECIKGILSKEKLCKLFSFVLMPKKNHEKSRKIFVREGKKTNKKELLYWAHFFKKMKNYKFIMKKINDVCDAPILFIMGSEDHMFLKGVQKNLKYLKKSSIKVIEKCGHVCNIEKYKEYNKIVLNFHKQIENTY